MSISIFDLRKKLKRLSQIEREKARLQKEWEGPEGTAITKAQIEKLDWEYNHIGSETIETVTYEGDD